MKKIVLALLFSSLTVSWLFAQNAPPKKKEVRLFLGYAFTQVDGASDYHDEWKFELLSGVTEDTRISAASENILNFSVSFSYLFRPHLGVQAGLGFLKTSVPNEASFDIAWTAESTHKEHKDWKGTGSLCIIPLNLNAFGLWNRKNFDVFVSGGPSLFFNKYYSKSYAGYGVPEVYKILTYIPPNWVTTVIQYIDALSAKLEINDGWLAWGMNFGFGIDFQASPKLTLSAEARYYLCPKRECSWEWKTGTYNGILPVGTYGGVYQGNIMDWEFSEENADYAQRLTTSFMANPSFFQLALGIKFTL